MKISETLRAAQETISDERYWCQGCLRQEGDYGLRRCAVGAAFDVPNRDSNNRTIQALLNALSIAATGWLERAPQTVGQQELIASAPGTMHPAAIVNDVFGHEAVMEVYAAAIEMAVEDEMKENGCPSAASLVSTPGSGTESDSVLALTS